jgi:hypothetical protein
MGMVMFPLVLVLIRVVMGVIAVDHMRGHEAMKQPRHDLYPQEAADEAAHHDQAGVHRVVLVLAQVLLGLG